MITKVLKFFYLLLSLVIILTSIYIKNNFYDVSFEQLLNSVVKSEGTSFDAVLNGLILFV